MVRLSVNVNKVATLRNARGGEVPDLLQAVRTIVGAGCRGIQGRELNTCGSPRSV